MSRDPIQNSPFWVVGDKEQGYFLIMGRWRISEIYTTKEKAIGALETDKWNIILRITGCMCEDIHKTEIHY